MYDASSKLTTPSTLTTETSQPVKLIEKASLAREPPLSDNAFVMSTLKDGRRYLSARQRSHCITVKEAVKGGVKGGVEGGVEGVVKGLESEVVRHLAVHQSYT
jgi:hypothetical protein